MEKKLAKITTILFFIVSLIGTSQNQELPNILWITSEDNSPMLGCYGDDYARTKNLDKLASEGFLYTHAYANAPVCAPARNTIASGIYANSGGHSNMRSFYERGRDVKYHAEVLRNLGYYCTNNDKTDYNSNVKGEIWDENSKTAHFKNAPKGKPWFSIFNTGISHEGSIFKQIPFEDLKRDTTNVPIAPYHPRTKDMVHDWAQYYQRIEEMDAFVGDILKQLEESGQADNTIVFYYGDHGGVLGRSKRFVYETGTRVPLIIRIPEKYKKLWPTKKVNSKIDRLVSFVDLFPTLLEIVGAEKLEQLQGEAFLGEKISPDPKYAYMFRDRMDEWYDMSRSVRSKKYRYIRNYMPHRIYGLPLEFMFRAKSLQSWKKACEEGLCNETQQVFWKPKPTEELYDTENDPWEINNLADDPNYKNILLQMRKANNSWVKEIKDTGFFPEDERLLQADGESIYDYFQNSGISIDSVIDAADLATLGDKKNINILVEYLKSDNAAIRYWGATGLLILGNDAKLALNDLKASVNDSSASVASVAAEALYNLGYKTEAYKGWEKAINTGREFAQTLAMNSIYLIDDNSNEMKDLVLEAYKSIPKSRVKYNYRAARNLINKWGLEID